MTQREPTLPATPHRTQGTAHPGLARLLARGPKRAPTAASDPQPGTHQGHALWLGFESPGSNHPTLSPAVHVAQTPQAKDVEASSPAQPAGTA